MMKINMRCLIILIILIMVKLSNAQIPVNLAHLDFMKEDRTGYSVVWLYSDYPKYERQRDPGEGVACVDDNARAVVTYCRYYEATGDTNALDKAENICKFIISMHAPPDPKAEYYNFIWEDGSINQDGNTSKRAFGSYAARACWALGYAFKVFKSVGGSYGVYADNTLNGHIDEFNVRFDNWNYSDLKGSHGYSFYNIPMDNSHNCGTALMGLIAWAEAGGGGTTVTNNIVRTCNNLTGWQFGDINTYPFKGFFTKYDNVTWLQGYGAYEVAALAYAADVFKRADWLQSAKDAVDYFYTIYLTGIYPGNEGRNPAIRQFPQIAFAISPFIEACYRVYKASRNMGDPASVYLKYAKYAGLFASFFMGNNIYGIPTYNSDTGICFDGIESPENPVNNRINRNSGGESTVETLNALLLVLTDTNCLPYVYAREEKRDSCIYIEAEDAEEISNGTIENDEWFGNFVSGQNFSKSKYVKLLPGGKIKKTFYTENQYNDLSDNYLVYLCYVKRVGAGDTINVKIDDKDVKFNTGGSPDSDYLFYDKLTNNGKPAVFNLPSGKHTIEISAANQELLIDQIGIQPVVQRKSFNLPTGEIINVDRPFLSETNQSAVPVVQGIDTMLYGNTLKVEWSKKNNVYGYNVYRKSDIQTNYSKINLKPVTKNYYIDNGLIPNSKYYYKITAISNYTWKESSFSSEISGVPVEPQTTKMKITETEYDWGVAYSGIYFKSTLYNGFAETKSYKINIDKYPDITIDINNPTGTYWSFNVLKWISDGAQFYTFEEVPLQNKTRDTGVFNYNLHSLFGWNGTKTLKFRFYISKNNFSTFVKDIKVHNINNGNVYMSITSPQLWFSYDGITPDYYEPNISLNIDNLNEEINLTGSVNMDNLELILYKTVSANFDYYKSVNFKIDTDNQWALYAVVNGEEITVAPYTKKTGLFCYNLKDISGGKISGLMDILFKFKIRTSGNVAFRLNDSEFSSTSLPVYYNYNGVRVLPNPFTPAADNPLFNRCIFYFDFQYGEDVKIKIFMINGKFVKEIDNAISGKAFWDGKDEDGNPVTSGIYIYQIFTKEKIQSGTVMIIR